jgi:hypothetical protein
VDIHTYRDGPMPLPEILPPLWVLFGILLLQVVLVMEVTRVLGIIAGTTGMPQQLPVLGVGRPRGTVEIRGQEMPLRRMP